MEGAEAARLALAADPARLRPCHCDPTGANLLDTGERVWLVDWEYSGMNDPMWDLAYLSVQSDFDPALDEALLAAYLGRPPGQRDRSRMALYPALVELLSALWALVQQCVGTRLATFNAMPRSPSRTAGYGCARRNFAGTSKQCGAAETSLHRRDSPVETTDATMADPSPEHLLRAALEMSEAAAAIPLRYFRSAVTVQTRRTRAPSL
jgi:Ser/Thr protein kinase RdoA (MazF antagonist)